MIGHTKRNMCFLGKNNKTKKQEEKLKTSLIIAGVLGFSVVSIVCASGKSYATATKVGDLAVTSTPTLTTGLSSNSLTVALDAGAFGSANNTVSVTTDCPTGYSLSLSSANATLSSISASEATINGASGTFNQPAVLGDDTWGYAVIGNDATAAETSGNTVINNFDSSYDTITETGSKFAAMPTSAQMIKATSGAANADTTTVYYGVNISETLAPDTYEGTVTYNTVANVSTIGAPQITSISPATDGELGGETVTITGSNFSVDGTVVAYAVKIGGQDCTGAEVFYDADTDTETITCTVPALNGTIGVSGETGVKDVTVSNWSGNTATLTGGFTYTDETAPVCSDITSTTTVKSATQTASINCTDAVGVVGYYFGTSSSPADGDYTAVTSTTSYATDETISSTGTYYLFVKDAAGNVSAVKSVTYNTYTVYPVLETTTGTEGVYTSANYEALAGVSYIYPSGESITVSNVYTTPTGGGTYLGYTTAAPGASAASLASSAYTISSDASLYTWFNRATYTITASASNGTVTLSGQRSQSSTSSISVRYGETATATATPASGYVFSSFSGLFSTTTNPYSWTATDSGTVTGNFSDNTAPVCTVTGGTTATLNCTDAAGVVGYYFGTTLNPSAGSYTAVTSSTDWSTTVTPGTVGVYYLYAKDAAGNVSTVVSAKYLRVEVEVGLPPKCYGQQYIMQDIANWKSSLTQGTNVTACDTRDESLYTVGKLADNKVWMLDNLAFNGKDNQGNGSYITMDSSNTNLAANDTETWDDTVTTGWASSTQNSYTDAYINDASKDTVSSDSMDQAGNWKVGVYYNYCAASAGTVCMGTSDTGASDEATSDICPKGWKMPSGNTTGDFGALANAIYGSTSYTDDPTAVANFRNALRLPLSGYFDSGSAYDQGSGGYWWSTTADDGSNRYILGAYASVIYPDVGDYRRSGNSVRCIAQ